MAVQTKIVLEPAAQELADAFSMPPFLYELDYSAARKVLDDAQAPPVEKPPIDEEWITVPCPYGNARVRIIRPQGATGTLPGDRVHARRWLGAR
jgi:acetyl esterase